jgi:hypothetical protein
MSRHGKWIAGISRGKNGKACCSFGFAQAFALGGDAAPARQAGGHWFEPSTAHFGPRRSAQTAWLSHPVSAICVDTSRLGRDPIPCLASNYAFEHPAVRFDDAA